MNERLDEMPEVEKLGAYGQLVIASAMLKRKNLPGDFSELNPDTANELLDSFTLMQDMGWDFESIQEAILQGRSFLEDNQFKPVSP